MDNLNPDKGFGKPGSLRFHILTIKSCETVEETLHYLCQIVEPQKVLEKLQEFAINIVKEQKNG